MATNYAYTRFFHYGFLLGWSCQCTPYSLLDGGSFDFCHCCFSRDPVGPLRGALCRDIGALLRRCPLPGENSEEVDWLAVTRTEQKLEAGDLAPFGESRRSRGNARGEPPLLMNAFPETGASVRQETHVSHPCLPDTPEYNRYVRDKKRKARKTGRKFWWRTETRLQQERERKIEACYLAQPLSKSPNRSDNKFSCLEDEFDDTLCKKRKKYQSIARNLLRFLGEDLKIEYNVENLPEEISCGELRPAVRGCFPASLPVLAELSIKTSMKAERSCCTMCRGRFDKKLDDWMEKMLQPVSIDDEHLNRFRKLFRANVPKDWHRNPGSYIPNGAATLGNLRRQGGNWNEEEISDQCRATLVFSSGKPRVVTCYSSGNVRVLSPLHDSLYKELGRKGWLLVGDPTPRRVAGLNGDGRYLSFDYIGATDSIKIEYTKAAIEILIDEAGDLSDEQKRCMRALGQVDLAKVNYPSGDSCSRDIDRGIGNYPSVFNRGQPMGSVLSFPLLCLINKTVVDLSLTDLLESREISFNDWTTHKCLINGDDLLLKEPFIGSSLKDRVIFNGGMIGLETNNEKCLQSECMAEINSTLFTHKGLVKEKKTNANAMYMKPEVNDVLGVAYEATRTVKAFKRAVRANANFLSQQEKKWLWKLPYPYQAACRKDKKIKKACLSTSFLRRDQMANLLPVVPVPEGYELTREEEVALIDEEVSRVRARAIELLVKKSKTKEKKRVARIEVKKPSWRSLLKREAPSEDTVLAVLARGYLEKQKAANSVMAKTEEETFVGWLLDNLQNDCEGSKINQMINLVARKKIKPTCDSHKQMDVKVNSEVKVLPVTLCHSRRWNNRFEKRRKFVDIC